MGDIEFETHLRIAHHVGGTVSLTFGPMEPHQVQGLFRYLKNDDGTFVEGVLDNMTATQFKIEFGDGPV